jgi:hypothetical protein
MQAEFSKSLKECNGRYRLRQVTKIYEGKKKTVALEGVDLAVKSAKECVRP